MSRIYSATDEFLALELGTPNAIAKVTEDRQMTNLEKMIVLAQAAGVQYSLKRIQNSVDLLSQATDLAMTSDAPQAYMARLNSEYKKAGGR